MHRLVLPATDSSGFVLYLPEWGECRKSGDSTDSPHYIIFH